MKTTMLALDTSTTCTGFAVYENGKLVDYGCLDFDPKVPMDIRLEEIIDRIYTLIDKLNPQIVVAEMTFAQNSARNNVETQKNLTLLLGAVWGKCVITGAYFHSFRASEWRKLVDSGKKPKKREELKKWSIDKVNSFLKTEINNDNISDAILIGQAYVNLFS